MPFWELTVPASADVSEGLTNFLWEQGALGVVEEETPGALPRLRAFFPEVTSSTALCRAVNHYLTSLRALGLSVDGGKPVVAPLLDEPWAEAWRQAFVPQRVGRRLLIVPPWERPAADHGLTTIVIEPGRAFGTGTGILAIAAAALGVPEVTALDTDPDAVAAAEANALKNGVRERIRCALADTAGVEAPAFPLILANLLTGSHLTHAPEYRRLLSPGGHLILGGILSDEAESVGWALAEHDFALAERTDVDGWASLLLYLGGGLRPPSDSSPRDCAGKAGARSGEIRGGP